MYKDSTKGDLAGICFRDYGEHVRVNPNTRQATVTKAPTTQR